MSDVTVPSMILPLVGLVLYHAIFFWGIYRDPFQMATSELLSTFYPTWRHRGKDNYWLRPNCHPVLSTYYPPQILSSLIGRTLSLDASFFVLLWSMLVHILFSSVGWFFLLKPMFGEATAVFGAITLSYQAFNLKQQPCIAYTHGWFPWCLSPNPIISTVSVGMLLLAGYYPLAIYLLPVVVLIQVIVFHQAWVLLGMVMGLIQVIPFLVYLPKTIRKPYGEGKLGPWELHYYFGLAPLVILATTFQKSYLTILIPVIMSYLLRKWLPRGYQRAWCLSVFIAMYFCLTAMVGMDRLTLSLLILIQCFDLWLHNHQLLPPRPFCELPKRPSLAFNTQLTRFLDANLDKDARVSGLPFPLFTGLVNGYKTLGYCGSMQLKLMAKWRGDTNPNGSGHHDYFMGKEDSDALDIGRVQFAFSRKRLDWPRTIIRNLYANPRYNHSKHITA